MDVLVATLSVSRAGGDEPACYAFPLPRPVATIGSGPGADLRLPIDALGDRRVRLEQAGDTLTVTAQPGDGVVRLSGAVLDDGESVDIGLPATIEVAGVLINLAWMPEPSVSRSLSLPSGEARLPTGSAPPFASVTPDQATELRSTDVAMWIAAQPDHDPADVTYGAPRRALERVALLVAVLGVLTAVFVLFMLFGPV